MPGIFGLVTTDRNAATEMAHRFQTAVRAVWPGSEWVEIDGGVVGADSPTNTAAIGRLPDDVSVAVDGTSWTHRAMARLLAGRGEESLFQRAGESIRLADGVVGNVACITAGTHRWHVAADWTGAFPLYFAHVPAGFIFSSLLRPLAHAIRGEVDVEGTLQFLRFGYMLGSRTFFRQVRRVLPGQHLTYCSRTGVLHVGETSRLWCGDADAGLAPAGNRVEAVTARLTAACGRAFQREESCALMMSAGWDSRTLLGITLPPGAQNQDLVGYTHGALESRETRLVRRLCETAGINLIENPLRADIFSPDYLTRRFAATEDVRFPHWHRAGEILHARGIQSVASGVYGEVLGGHYGPPFRLRGRSRADYILRSLCGLPAPVSAERLLRVSTRWRRDHLADGVVEDATRSGESVNAEIQADLARLRARGIADDARLFEAFITEHRGSQMVVAQPLSIRSSGAVPISLPYCDRELLRQLTALPVAWRIHNRLNRAILSRTNSRLLRFPTGAVLVPARAPILLQESSRVVAHLLEERGWRRYVKAAGALRSPWVGWNDFEFLRRERCLTEITDDLKAPLWNRGAIRKDLEDNVYHFGSERRVFSAAMELLRMYTVDLMLRPQS